jgi:hypothetical protein
MEMDSVGSSAPLGGPLIQINDVFKVSQNSLNSVKARGISLCTSFEALVLVALTALTRSSGRESGGFDVEELMAKMKSMADALGDRQYLPAPSLQELLGLLSRLGEAHLITNHTTRNSSLSYRASIAGSGGAWPLVSGAVEDEVVWVALKDSPHKELAAKFLMNSF